MSSTIDIKDKIKNDRSFKITPFKKEVRKTAPHKHNNYFEVIFLSEGSGYHFIDSKPYEVKPPIIYFVRKEQIHYWELISEPEGYVIIIKKSFIDLSLDKEIKKLLYKLSKTTVLSLKETGTLTTLLQLLVLENEAMYPSLNPVVEGLLKALLAKLLLEGIPFSTDGGTGDDLYDCYQEILSQDKDLRNSVSYYASKLNTSPQNLNAACRRSSDMSAAAVLSEFVISEAKRLLIYTDKTISEIAFTLGFNDSSHFIKYFKRRTDKTPKIFRNEQN